MGKGGAGGVGAASHPPLPPSSPTLLHLPHPSLSAAESMDRAVRGGVVSRGSSVYLSEEVANSEIQTLKFSCH